MEGGRRELKVCVHQGREGVKNQCFGLEWLQRSDLGDKQQGVDFRNFQAGPGWRKRRVKITESVHDLPCLHHCGPGSPIWRLATPQFLTALQRETQKETLIPKPSEVVRLGSFPGSRLPTFFRISAQSQPLTSPSPALSRCRSVETML